MISTLATYEKSTITVQLMQTSKNLDHFLWPHPDHIQGYLDHIQSDHGWSDG
jgi:hypothetical protein